MVRRLVVAKITELFVKYQVNIFNSGFGKHLVAIEVKGR